MPRTQKPLAHSRPALQRFPLIFRLPHEPSPSQVLRAPHSLSGSEPKGISAHAPRKLFRLHATHEPEHALEQQTPSTQKPLLQAGAPSQRSPFGLSPADTGVLLDVTGGGSLSGCADDAGIAEAIGAAVGVERRANNRLSDRGRSRWTWVFRCEADSERDGRGDDSDPCEDQERFGRSEPAAASARDADRVVIVVVGFAGAARGCGSSGGSAACGAAIAASLRPASTSSASARRRLRVVRLGDRLGDRRRSVRIGELLVDRVDGAPHILARSAIDLRALQVVRARGSRGTRSERRAALPRGISSAPPPPGGPRAARARSSRATRDPRARRRDRRIRSGARKEICSSSSEGGGGMYEPRIKLAAPRSRSFTPPSLVMKIFDGRSPPWMIDLSCAAARTSSTCIVISMTRRSGSRRAFDRKRRSRPKPRNSSSRENAYRPTARPREHPPASGDGRRSPPSRRRQTARRQPPGRATCRGGSSPRPARPLPRLQAKLRRRTTSSPIRAGGGVCSPRT